MVNKMILGLCHTTLTGEPVLSTLFIIVSFRLQSAGRTAMLVESGGTSKTCSGCGWVKKDLNPPDRIFHCDSCGLEIGRDLNATINILRMRLVKVGQGMPEYTPEESAIAAELSKGGLRVATL